jgi:hypothetical protein
MGAVAAGGWLEVEEDPEAMSKGNLVHTNIYIAPCTSDNGLKWSPDVHDDIFQTTAEL